LEIIEMKKTLTALAAVAATGASFAQVTMVGNIGFSWQQSPVVTASAAGQHVQGFAIQDGEIYITAVEDMGDGWKATARGGFTMRGRGNGVADRDATVSLTTPFGVLTTGALRSCGSINAQLSGVVTGTVYSSNESNNSVPLDKCSMIDVVTFSTKLADATVSVTYGEFEAGATALNSNDRGNSNGITFTALGADYPMGPLTLGGDWTNFGAVTVYTLPTAATGTTASATGSALVGVNGANRYRLYAKYDAGVAKFAAGYQIKDWAADQYVASVAVPYGNFTFGLDYMGRGEQTYVATAAQAAAGLALSGTRLGDKASSALGLGATYNLSKTTTVNASYITYTDAGVNVDPTTKVASKALLDTEYRIRLMKSF
jgi:hypothetical protein